jgi:hypothetical protein
MLSIPAVNWSDRAKFDRTNTEMHYQGKVYDFDKLAALRAKEDLAGQCELAEQERRHARCQAAITTIADLHEQTRPDVTVIIGNDQMEVFTPGHVPAFAVFWGESVDGIPRTKEFLEKLPPGIAQAELDRTPAVLTKYPCDAKLGKHLIEGLISAEFDVSQLTELPTGQIGSNAAPHAYGFIYRRVLRDKLVPTVPVFVNTFYEPNQPSAGRCYDFGRALGRTIKHSSADKTVAIIASGGLSHFVIDETLDRRLIDDLERGDATALRRVPESFFQSGTSEWKNWIVAAGAMREAGLKMKMVDYVPCYRSEAGTGSGLGTAIWQ